MQSEDNAKSAEDRVVANDADEPLFNKFYTYLRTLSVADLNSSSLPRLLREPLITALELTEETPTDILEAKIADRRREVRDLERFTIFKKPKEVNARIESIARKAKAKRHSSGMRKLVESNKAELTTHVHDTSRNSTELYSKTDNTCIENMQLGERNTHRHRDPKESLHQELYDKGPQLRTIQHKKTLIKKTVEYESNYNRLHLQKRDVIEPQYKNIRYKESLQIGIHHEPQEYKPLQQYSKYNKLNNKVPRAHQYHIKYQEHQKNKPKYKETRHHDATHSIDLHQKYHITKNNQYTEDQSNPDKQSNDYEPNQTQQHILLSQNDKKHYNSKIYNLKKHRHQLTYQHQIHYNVSKPQVTPCQRSPSHRRNYHHQHLQPQSQFHKPQNHQTKYHESRYQESQRHLRQAQRYQLQHNVHSPNRIENQKCQLKKTQKSRYRALYDTHDTYADCKAPAYCTDNSDDSTELSSQYSRYSTDDRHVQRYREADHIQPMVRYVEYS